MAEAYNAEVVRAQMAAHHDGQTGFANNGRKNAYECEDCGAWIVTIDREPGVTPFMVECGICRQMATSKFYRVADRMQPTHEWYRPETSNGLSPWSLEHVSKGGLLLRTIDGHDSREGWQTSPPETLPDTLAEARAALTAKLDALDKEQAAILAKMAEPCPIKREDYPSRQTYRAARAKWRR